MKGSLFLHLFHALFPPNSQIMAIFLREKHLGIYPLWFSLSNIAIISVVRQWIICIISHGTQNIVTISDDAFSGCLGEETQHASLSRTRLHRRFSLLTRPVARSPINMVFPKVFPNLFSQQTVPCLGAFWVMLNVPSQVLIFLGRRRSNHASVPTWPLRNFPILSSSWSFLRSEERTERTHAAVTIHETLQTTMFVPATLPLWLGVADLL